MCVCVQNRQKIGGGAYLEKIQENYLQVNIIRFVKRRICSYRVKSESLLPRINSSISKYSHEQVESFCYTLQRYFEIAESAESAKSYDLGTQNFCTIARALFLIFTGDIAILIVFVLLHYWTHVLKTPFDGM